MKLARKLIILTATLWLNVVLVLAQEDCIAIVQAALDATDRACDATGRNQACYGNIRMSAEPREGVADFSFDNPGEIVDVAGVQTLTLMPWDAAEHVWGIALMQLQTSLPDTLPGQNVTFLLFGDVKIDDAVETNTEPVTIEVTAQSNVNVRSGPSSDDERVAGLSDGETVIASGRNAESDWLRITLDDNSFGWVSADLVEVADEISLLNVIDPIVEPAPTTTPMQAFYFRSGIGDAPCADAPDSGILVQTPDGVGQIEFTVNEVNISLGSTIYLQAQPGGDMTISVVEGQAEVEAVGVTVVAPAGTRVRVPLNNNRQASGPPDGPEPYGNLSSLPVTVLERDITIAPPLTDEETATLVSTPENEVTPETTVEPLAGTSSQAAGDIQLISGEWQLVTVLNECSPSLDSIVRDIVFESEDEGTTLIITFSSPGGSVTSSWNRTEQNTYSEQTSGAARTIHILSPDHFMIEGVLTLTPSDSCRSVADVTLITPAEEDS
jgi:uncharacterized protein YgiM (DUF1202 family)